MLFTIELAAKLAKLPMSCVCREYPNKLDHVLNSQWSLKSPKELHPAFYGCFDWHSSVHGHWMLVRLLKLFDLPKSAQIRALLNENLTAEKIQVEAAYLSRQNTQSFERPYGWAWLLKLAEELFDWNDPDGAQWAENLKPLELAFVDRYLNFFPKQTYPVRVGAHANTAFGLSFAFDYAVKKGHVQLEAMVKERALAYFEADAGYPTKLEPSGADFLSPCLVEADLMRRVMSPADFARWFHNLIPDLEWAVSLLEPATVSDRSDPQIGHLDGLNLSRAWCMNGIASALDPSDAYHRLMIESAENHADHGLNHIATGDYMGEHWLASFAVYLLSN